MQQYGSLLGGVKPKQKFEHGALAGACAAGQRDLFPHFHLKAEMAKHGLLFIIAEGHVPQFHKRSLGVLHRGGRLWGKFALCQKLLDAADWMVWISMPKLSTGEKIWEI